MKHSLPIFMVWVLVFAGFAPAGQAGPRHVYLTWQGDTSTTMTVNYQTLEDPEASTVRYDTRSRKGKADQYRWQATGTRHKIDGLEDGRTIHWVELTGLKPNTTYYFVAGDEKTGFTEERRFRTVAADERKLRFVVGGDMGTGGALGPLLKAAAKEEPQFAVIGGDIAYANDRLTNYARWDAWLDAWQQGMVTPKGFTIPMVLAIGNHEVNSTVNAPTNALFYFGYFAQEGMRSYASRKFGRDVVIYLLDSGHITPHGPEQAAWLDAQMEADGARRHRFAVYHVPLYPAHRAYDGSRSADGRKTWLPVFDKHRLTAAFEHHDHVYKRTKLLRNNQPDPQGTLYLGDGCWGMGSRTVDKVRRWYEDKAAALQHFWRVDVANQRVEYRAINKEGKVFDVYPPGAKGAEAAEELFLSLTQPAVPEPASGGQ